MNEEIKQVQKDAAKVSKGVEPLRDGKEYFLGIDIGSTSSDVVLLDSGYNIVLSDYCRTNGKPIETIVSQLEKVFATVEPGQVKVSGVTGSAGRLFAELAGATFVNEVSAQAAAVAKLYPEYKQATIVEMGGQDSKLIFLSEVNGVVGVRDFALNTVCAAGTGSFLDQQAMRLGVDIEGQFGELAMQSETVPRIAGRCSVFAKSDMIHLQQLATPVYDIVAGLCLALARSLKNNLGAGREFVRPIVFTGGVAANAGVVRGLEEVFGLGADELIVPGEHFFTGALGAVLCARQKVNSKSNGKLDLARVNDYLSDGDRALAGAPRRERLSFPSVAEPVSRVYSELLAGIDEPIEAYLGVDVGSISTNVVVIDSAKRVLSKVYLMTAGRPLEAVKQGLEIVGEQVKGKVKIMGGATTGSGRYLTGDFVGADTVINEITAQAAGAAIVNPQVDTIFEIGGQDSKYISLENGVVVDFEMNHACAAGTGSFLEEQAQRLGLNIKEQFAAKAFESGNPIKLGERCTVFMESDLLSFQQQGAKTEDLVAGLSYSIVTNYLNRVVGRRKIGDNICFQGGTAFNKAVVSAFESVTGKSIMVPDHHEVTGAIGAASIAKEYMRLHGKTESTFKGFDSCVNADYKVETFVCKYCANECEIKKVDLGGEPLYYGSRCDRYNLKKKDKVKSSFDAFGFRNDKLFEYARINRGAASEKESGKVTIGLPMALVNWQYLPMFSVFFKSLGFEVVLSGKTTAKVIHKGVETVAASTCFPVKVAYGHIAELIEKKVDYIFVPSIVAVGSEYDEGDSKHLCPYVQTLCYQVRSAFAGKFGDTKLLTVPMRLGPVEGQFYKSFVKLGKELGKKNTESKKAAQQAKKAQESFDKELKDKGREIVKNIKEGERLFVLVSRPYNGCDFGVNLELPKKLNAHGVCVMPLDMLDVSGAELTDADLHRKMFWSYGQRILRAAEVIRDDDRLFAVYLTNFSCGPDSFITSFFKDIMAHKPSLMLEMDEHSADAGLITRLEAYLESLKHYKANGETVTKAPPHLSSIDASENRTLYVPYMGDCSYGFAANLRAYGQPAEVMEVSGESALIKGRAFTTGKECLPCALTTGDMLNTIDREGFDASKAAFFMPCTSGPCRFGMYNCMLRLVLKYTGNDDVVVVSPNQDSKFYRELLAGLGVRSAGKFLRMLWASMVGVDILRKALHRLRPFAKAPGQVQKVYDDTLARWVATVESRSSFSQLKAVMSKAAEEFGAIEYDMNVQKPRIGIVGEIYVRNHHYANCDVIKQLESLGAVCDLAATAEWIYYTNFMRARLAMVDGDIGHWLSNNVKTLVQHRIDKELAKPLEAKFGPLAEKRVEHVIELAKPYIHYTYEGEAILSVGKMVEYYEEGYGGVVNVMPFSCMPSTIVCTQSRRISSDCGDMPILNLSFDGQEDATLGTRLEAFVEQIRRRSTVGINELISV